MQSARACRRQVWLPRVTFVTSARRAYRNRPGPFAIYHNPQKPAREVPAEVLRKSLNDSSNAELEQRLSWTAKKKLGSRLPVVTRLLNYMHQKRGIRPTLAHYEAEVLANTDPDGSAQNVKNILLKMKERGVASGALVDSAVLEVGGHQ
jgi:hypothetical protein